MIECLGLVGRGRPRGGYAYSGYVFVMKTMKRTRNSQDKAQMTFLEMFALGFGSIIGVGWSSTLNNLLKNGGGAIPATITFVIATFLFLPIAYCFSMLASEMPGPGGVTNYANKAFGKKTAFVAGWFMTMAYMAILPFESIAVSDILGYIFPKLKEGTVLYSIAGEDVYLSTALIGVGFGILICLVNWRGMKAGVRFQKVMITSLLIGSSICVAFCLFKADVGYLLNPIYAPVQGMSHSTMLMGILTLLAMTPQYFSGFDTIPQSAEFANARTMKRSMLVAVVFAGLFYCLIFVTTGLAYPWQITVQLGRPVLSNLLIAIYPGSIGKMLWYICIISTLAGLFSAWNGFFLASTRALYGMAIAKLLPKAFLKSNSRFGTPLLPLFLCAGVMFAGPFLGAGVLDIICKLASAGFIVAWGIASSAAYKLQAAGTLIEKGTAYKKRMSILSLSALVICVIMLLNSVLPVMPGFMGTGGIVALVSWSSLGLILCRYCMH